MVAVLKRHETGLLGQSAVAPVVEAHLDGHLHAGGTVVRQKAAGQARRRQGNQPLGQTYGRFVSESGEDHVLELPQLFGERRIDARVGMPEEIDPPGAHGIEIAFAVEILEPRPRTASNRDHRQGFVVLHLRAGMPHDAQVARGEGGGSSSFGAAVHICGIVAYANARIGNPRMRTCRSTSRAG